MSEIHLSIISPAYQDEEYIEQTIREIYSEVVNRAQFSIEVIIAEDGSTDRTREILAELQKTYGFKFISDSKRKGHIKATKELYKKAKGEFIFFLDSDGECHPKDFWKLYEKLQKNKLDMVIGSRRKRKPLHRRLITKIESLVARFLFDLKVEDPNCPFRITSKTAAKKIVELSGRLRYNFNLEQIIWAKKHSFTFLQAKVTHRKRKSVLSPPQKIAGQVITAFIEIVKFRLSFNNSFKIS